MDSSRRVKRWVWSGLLVALLVGLWGVKFVNWKLRKDIARATKDPELYYNLGVSIANDGRYDDAILLFKTAIIHKPDFAEAHYWLGKMFIKVGDTASALNEYEILKELDYDLANGLLNLLKQ